LTETKARTGVRWSESQNVYLCDECNGLIQPGDRMARWTEEGLGSYGFPFHINRRYCEDCGQLLEDSLTTTEAV